jgi:signal transduction histidine kinase
LSTILVHKIIDLKYSKASLKFVIYFTFLFIFSNVHATTLDSLFQVQSQLEQNANKKELIDLNISIARILRTNQKYSKLLEISFTTLEIQDEIQDNSLKYIVYNNIGYAYEWLSDYHKALKYYDLSLESALGIEEDEKFIASVYGRKAAVYKSIGNYEKSYENQLQALKVAEELQDSIQISTSYYQMGSLFYYQKQYEKALEFYKKAQVYAVAKGGEIMAYSCLAAMGTTYENLGDLEKALDFNQESLVKARELKHASGIAYSLANIGSTYMSKKEYEKAYDYIIESLELKKAQKDKWGEIGSLRTLADLFIQKGTPEKAIPFLEEAYTLAKETKSKTRQLELLEFFALAYKGMGDYEKAYHYRENSFVLKDSILNESTLVEMEKMNVSIKESQILLLKKDNEVLAKEQEIDQLYNYIWTVLALLFGVLLLLFVSRYRAQKRSSVLLQEKNEQINSQNGELQKVNGLLSETNKLLEQNKQHIEEQNKALESSNEDLRNFASVASHDLKEPLRMINSYTSILKKKYEGLFDERAHEFMGFVIDGVSRMELLLNGLLDYSRVSIRGNENYKLVNSKDIVDIVQGNLRFPIIKNSATINVENYENFPVIKANQVQMIQLIQNLVSNALKFQGDRLPVVTIGFKREDDFYTFYVKDNGIGISKENQEKIFEMLTRLHTKEEYEGTGIGLATVKKIVERHKGKIWVESIEGQGSTFFFTMPVVKAAEPVLA